MGEMTVKGYAERKVECDTVKYTLGFNADGLTIPDAVKKVNAELEHFLEIMEKNGITADRFEIVDNKSAEKYGHNEEKMPYYSKRIVSITMPLIAKNVNSMMQYISDYKLNVVSDEEYFYSKIKELHEELLKEAVADSRKKAELIASFTGQKIKGIKSVFTEYSEFEDQYPQDSEIKVFKLCESRPSLAGKLSNPTIVETEDVSIVWLIED